MQQQPIHHFTKSNLARPSVVASDTTVDTTASKVPTLTPVTRHYYSHRIPQHATLVPSPVHRQSSLHSSSLFFSPSISPSVRSNQSPLVSGIANGQVARPPERYSIKMPRRGFDNIRRLPIVVIPRKRKYKNYVSRRRNTQLIASLRRCVSDPVLYRSFNRWEGLTRPFSPQQSGAPIADIPEATSFDDNNRAIETMAAKPPALKESAKLKRSKDAATFAERKKSGAKEEFQTGYKGEQKLAAVAAGNKAEVITSCSDDVILDVNKEQEGLAEVVLRAPTPPTTSRIRPRNVATRSIVLPRATVVEPSVIKRRLSSRTKREDSGYRKDHHREYVNLPSVSDNLDEKEEERTAEQKAQNTVTAVTAAFSTLVVEPQLGHERGGIEAASAAVAAAAANAGTGAGTTVGGAATVVGGGLGVTNENATKSDENDKRGLKIIAPDEGGSGVGDGGQQRKSRKEIPQLTAIALMPPSPVLKRKPSSTASFSQSSLLATLQLPPSVSAKVDRIIANADRKEKERRSNHAPINSVYFLIGCCTDHP